MLTHHPCRHLVQPEFRRQVRRASPTGPASILCFLLALLSARAEGTGLPAWPAPPAEPYIVYVRSISKPADVGAKSPSLKRVANWLTGGASEFKDLVKPFGLSLDEAGGLTVTDTGANAVCYLDPAKKTWLRWDAVGKTRFSCPVAAVHHGKLFYVADSSLGKVIAFDEKGKLQFEITNDLERPAGLAIFGEKLLIVDSQLHQVVVCDLSGKFVSKFGRRGAGSGEFNFPTHVAVDSKGLVYVTDSLNCRVQIFDPNGKFQQAIGSAGDRPGHFSRPKGVGIDTSGHIYVVDGVFDSVQTFNREGQLLINWGESGSEPGEFWLPNALTVSRDNEIYVADSYNHRIQVFRYTGKQ